MLVSAVDTEILAEYWRTVIRIMKSSYECGRPGHTLILKVVARLMPAFGLVWFPSFLGVGGCRETCASTAPWDMLQTHAPEWAIVMVFF